MDQLLHDVKYALRRLRNRPGFTLVALITLALGIGANSAMFTVVHGVLFRPLPYAAPDRLVLLSHLYPSIDGLEAPVSAIGFGEYAGQTALLERAAVETPWQPNLTGRGDPERVLGARVSGDFFRTLGVAPLHGRAIVPDDAAEGPAPIAVLGHGFWQRAFGGDPSAIGRMLTLDEQNYEIVGIMPPGFRDVTLRDTEFWVPLHLGPEALAMGRTNEWLTFIGRLRAGVDPEAARGGFAAFAERLKEEYPGAYPPDWSLALTTLPERASGGSRTALLMLLGAVGFVLLIACANVANFELSRAAARSRELGVRIALGASPGRLVRQLLTESLLLALAGGLIGLVLAVWGVPFLISLDGRSLPRPDDIQVDGVVLAFTAAASLLSGLLFGLAPALQAARSGVHESLKEGGRGASAGTGVLVRRGLVVSSVALALTLLVGSGLLIRSFARLQGVDPGFEPDGVIAFNLTLPDARYPEPVQQQAFFDELLPQLAAIPGVTGVAGANLLPFTGGRTTTTFSIEGIEVPPGETGPWGDFRVVTPEFFGTLGITLRAGRVFASTDAPGAARVAIVDELLAQRYWPGEDPLGKRVSFSARADTAPVWIEVVGVVAHASQEGLDDERRPQVYLPFAQSPRPRLDVAVRTAGDPAALTPVIRAAVRRIDPNLPVSRIATMESLVEATAGPRRFAVVLLAIFSGVAVTLAMVGLYGVLSQMVAQRTRELGIRLALGAQARDLLRMVVRQGMALTAAGVVIGLAISLLLTRLIASLLYGISPTDLTTFATIATLLLLVAFVATWIPSRRATRVDPAVALRAE